MFKTFLIIFLLSAAIAIGGGGFYYFEVYQPRDYAVSLLALYHKIESKGLQPEASLLSGAADYENAFKVLNGRISMLESIKKDIAAIQAPKRMENYQKEFSEYVDFALPRHERAAILGLFVKAASDLHTSIQAVYGGGEDREKIKTIGDLQKLWEEHIAKIKSASGEMFRKEIKELEKPSFSELKILWDGASPGFDLIFKKIKTFNPKTPLTQVGNAFSPAEQKRLNAYAKNSEKLLKELEALTQKYSAYDLLTLRHFPDATPQEASERALKFYQVIQKLKEQYAE